MSETWECSTVFRYSSRCVGDTGEFCEGGLDQRVVHVVEWLHDRRVSVHAEEVELWATTSAKECVTQTRAKTWIGDAFEERRG